MLDLIAANTYIGPGRAGCHAWPEIIERRRMGSQVIQIIILAAVALFLVLRLRSVLGTRDGFEGQPKAGNLKDAIRDDRNFEVIDGGGTDPDISDYADPDSETGRALAAIKGAEPEFSVGDFAHGARQAYEMIIMAFENGDLETLEGLLAPDVYASFAEAVRARQEKNLVVDAGFVGVREVKLSEAHFDEETRQADITMRFVGELTSVVRDREGKIVEGSPNKIRRQKDVWTFSRVMGSDDPNWILVATGA